MISRTGYTGELGFEIWCHPSDAMRVWERVWQLGKPLGLVPLGLEALDMLRIGSRAWYLRGMTLAIRPTLMKQVSASVYR